MSIIVSADQVKEIIDKNTDCIIFDCRGDLNNHDLSLKQYQESHLPRAIFLDGEKDLSAAVKEHGGRHPLPDMHLFAQKMREHGVNNTSVIIAYGLYAPRLIFMLHLSGLTRVHLIDGGFAAWIQSDFPVTPEISKPQTGNFSPEFNSHLLALMPEVKSRLYDKHTRLIDSRASERYRGETEPLDRIAGHIPGADNYFWQSNFDEKDFLKSKKVLFEQIAKLEFAPDDEKILYCGSGITAAFNYIVFKDLGIDCRIYAGSYSDWVSYPENEVRNSEK